jgi:hypothetical protein
MCKPVRILEPFLFAITYAKSTKLKWCLGIEGERASMAAILVLDFKSMMASWVATIFAALFS